MNVNLELKNLKLAKFASEETPCYEAILYLNGKRVAAVRNDGHGGPDMVEWRDKNARPVVEAYFASLPLRKTEFTVDGKPFEIQPDLEEWCHTQVWEQDTLKSIKRMISRKIVGYQDGKEWSFKLKPADLPRMRDALLKRYPGMLFMNEMTDAEIMAIVRRPEAVG